MSEHKHVKILVLGDAGVGKTAITVRFVADEWLDEMAMPDEYDDNVNNSYTCNMTINDEMFELDIIDTVNLQFQSFQQLISPPHQRHEKVFFLVYSVTSMQSFKNAQERYKQICRILEHVNDSWYLVLVGNKTDLIEHREVDYNTAKKSAKEWNFPLIETSAKNDINVASAFTVLVEQMIAPPKPQPADTNCCQIL